MMPIMDDIQTYELEIQTFWANSVIDEESLASFRDAKVYIRYMLEDLAYRLTAMMKVPAKVLQTDNEVAKWPARRWDNFLVAVCLDKYAKFKRLHFTEMLLFPAVTVPPNLCSSMKIYTQSL